MFDVDIIQYEPQLTAKVRRVSCAGQCWELCRWVQETWFVMVAQALQCAATHSPFKRLTSRQQYRCPVISYHLLSVYSLVIPQALWLLTDTMIASYVTHMVMDSQNERDSRVQDGYGSAASAITTCFFASLVCLGLLLLMQDLPHSLHSQLAAQQPMQEHSSWCNFQTAVDSPSQG